MGVWTAEVHVEGRAGALLLDSVTMRPIDLPLFDDVEQAERFLGWAHDQGAPDVRALHPEVLDALHRMWRELEMPGPMAEDDLEGRLAASVAQVRVRRVVAEATRDAEDVGRVPPRR